MLTESLYTQTTCTTQFAFRQRRRSALVALGLDSKADSFAVQALPLEGPFLFSGKFLDTIDQELSMQKRASEVSRKIQQLPGSSHSFRGASFPSKGFKSRGRASSQPFRKSSRKASCQSTRGRNPPSTSKRHSKPGSSFIGLPQNSFCRANLSGTPSRS